MSADVTNRRTDLAYLVAELRRELNELKSRQLVGWDSLVTYKTHSQDQYDISRTLTQGQVQQYEITFTYDRARAGAIMDMQAFYRVNNADVMAFPNPRRAPTNPQIEVRWRKSESGDRYAKWRLFVMNTASAPATYTGYVKLFFDGTDSGSFSIQTV